MKRGLQIVTLGLVATTILGGLFWLSTSSEETSSTQATVDMVLRERAFVDDRGLVLSRSGKRWEEFDTLREDFEITNLEGDYAGRAFRFDLADPNALGRLLEQLDTLPIVLTAAPAITEILPGTQQVGGR